MIVRKLRLKRGWSQAHLAELVGVSSRTIQRIEQGQKPSLETSKALASVFEVELSNFQTEELTMGNEETLDNDEHEAITYGKNLKQFYEGLIVYVVISAIVLAVFGANKFIFLVLGLAGLGPVIQGLITFELLSILSPKAERKLVEKCLGKKL
jgi:transcriptional regulator with XRE-family HTH domain